MAEQILTDLNLAERHKGLPGPELQVPTQSSRAKLFGVRGPSSAHRPCQPEGVCGLSDLAASQRPERSLLPPDPRDSPAASSPSAVAAGQGAKARFQSPRRAAQGSGGSWAVPLAIAVQLELDSSHSISLRRSLPWLSTRVSSGRFRHRPQARSTFPAPSRCRARPAIQPRPGQRRSQGGIETSGTPAWCEAAP